MFCSKCGQQIDDSSKFCMNCGEAMKNAGTQNTSGTDDEIVLKEGLCNRIKSKLYVQNGHGLLTNKRFVYSKHSFAKMAAIGVLVNLTKGSYDFEIPVSEMTGIKEGRQGISKTIIICTRSGEEYSFYFTDKINWEIHFNNVIRK